MILGIIGRSLPTPTLSDAYFANLGQLLAGRPLLPQPGRIVFGIGPGRCGSTSLTLLLTTIPTSRCTHENPPIVGWQPLESEIAFHRRRLAMLTRHFVLVFDAAHWWLNLADGLLGSFPTASFIGLRRDAAACVQSFLTVKGGLNHWAPTGNPIWRSNLWDVAYPTYPLVDSPDTESTRRAFVARYVDEYHEAMDRLVEAYPDRVLEIRTETLSEESTHRRLFAFLGLTGKSATVHLNAGTTSDGRNDRLRY